MELSVDRMVISEDVSDLVEHFSSIGSMLENLSGC